MAPFRSGIGGQRGNSWLVFRRQDGGISNTTVVFSGKAELELLSGPLP